MTLREVLTGVVHTGGFSEQVAGQPVTGLAYDSRRVSPGHLFFAFTGSHVDGARFAQQAVERGALLVISESAAPAGFLAPWLQVPHGRVALAQAARNYYGHPERRVPVTGVTGTNGKTTTAFLIDAMLRALGRQTGLIGTVEYRIGDERRPAVNTTPESLDVYQILAALDQMGGQHLTMEISSHALALGRVQGLGVHTAVFTNLTQDHLDFHGTMDAYFEAKRLLFQGMGGAPPRCAVVNTDDSKGMAMVEGFAGEVYSYGLGDARVRATGLHSGFDGIRFTAEHDGVRTPVQSPLVGTINVYNLLAAFCVGLSYGIAPEQAAAGLQTCTAVPGRFERVIAGQPFLVLVDYSHTEDALRNAIRAARDLQPRRVLTLFGCGGDRDRTKRPRMAAAAVAGSDWVVLTSDNPRTEDPLRIMEDAEVGFAGHDTPYVLEPDRITATRLALSRAEPGDVVLLAGKGHETYQIIGTETLPYDDRTVAREILSELGYSAAQEQPA